MNVSDKSRVLIAFGSNVGDSRSAYEQVQQEFAHHHMTLLAASQPISTKPIGSEVVAQENAYLNAALLVETKAGPEETIQSLLKIEQQMGRVRDRRWGPRTVDLDLLLFEELIQESEGLICPHPRMSFRRFVLEPACEIAAEMKHPTSGLCLSQLLKQLMERESLILWVGAMPKEVLALDKSVTPLGQLIEWVAFDKVVSSPKDTSTSVQLCRVDSVAEFRRLESRAKLVVLPSAQLEKEWNEAIRFSGATLRLDDEAIHPVRELVSALDAMK